MSISPVVTKPVRSLSAPAPTQLGIYSPRVQRLLRPEEGTDVAKCVEAVEALLNADRAKENPKERSFSPLATMLLREAVQKFRTPSERSSPDSGAAAEDLRVKAEEIELPSNMSFIEVIEWLKAESSHEAVTAALKWAEKQPLCNLSAYHVERAAFKMRERLEGGSLVSPAAGSSSAAAAAAWPR